jgi:rhodanese-related sulfurtransferase
MTVMSTPDSHDSSMRRQLEKLLCASGLSRVPDPQLAKVLEAVQAASFKAGEVVIRQGDPGTDFFLVGEGRVRVERERGERQTPAILAELAPGATFGEEALIANRARNATVRMLTDGQLFRVPKPVFDDAIRRPLLTSVDYAGAQDLIANGAVWLDVRTPTEVAAGGLPASLPIPFQHLRPLLDRLRRDRRYIVVCDKGVRSAVAAFLMAGKGHEVHFLEGGLRQYGLLRPIASGPDLDILSSSMGARWQHVAGKTAMPASHLTDHERRLLAPAPVALPPPPVPAAGVQAASSVRAELDIEHFEQEFDATAARQRGETEVLTPAEHMARQRAVAAAAKARAEAHNAALLRELEERLGGE